MRHTSGRSLIRNDLALLLGSGVVFSGGLKWTPSGQHLEVWLNGNYVIVFLLTEDIRIAAARLNIKEMGPSATVNHVDGGYIVEVDSRLDCYKGDDVDLQLVLPHGQAICIDTPDEVRCPLLLSGWLLVPPQSCRHRTTSAGVSARGSSCSTRASPASLGSSRMPSATP